MGTLRDLQFALQFKIEELRQRDTLIDELELELDTKDELIRRLQGELDRCRATIPLPGPSAVSTGCSAEGEDSEYQTAERKTIISEPFDPDLMTVKIPNRGCDKSQESQRLIQASFLKNDFFKHLDGGQIRAVVDCIYPTTVKQGCCVIEEGSEGALAYILDEGRLDMTKDGQKLLTVEPGNMFAELALLYRCTHPYSVTALMDSKLWVIDQNSFQTILMQNGLRSLSRSMELLSSVPFLQSLPEDVIMNMSDLMEEIHYTEDDYIIRQGATGDTFYIITEGQVNVTARKSSHEEPVVLYKLSQGQWFGEKALWGEDVRTENVVASGEVTCLVIDKEAFKNAVDGLPDRGHDERQNSESRIESDRNAAFLSRTTLSDFQVICRLGVGETGHVDLVQLSSNTKCPFAMRVLRKRLIPDRGQQEHILRERHILMEAHGPFIVRLHRTFRDAQCLYMLMEACLGGDLRSLLKDRGSFDDGTARFYTACVVQALIFLHCRGVIYRDLKPENVVLDNRGYAKLVGSGCAKKVEAGRKTWTFCGTPGYMAPEILLNKGHSVSADVWSLGIFVFELLSGSFPFNSPGPMQTFAASVRGIDQVDFPKTISESAAGLIRMLCRNNPAERLGSQRNGAKDILKHKWFEGFSWEGLCSGTLQPPIIPKISHPSESSRPDHYPAPPDSSPEWLQNWDKDF
ncbi:cGMP-dependent protein kinase 1 [Lampris incognitus]|uniref:cGMP-dependent protein kinase 1 n=1 Tax=Lampris incognitus TaxID=2546036 RepID=UPI0024B55DE5|nr:cGMP-dependent protein kinase 1 [Lampris incognitus]